MYVKQLYTECLSEAAYFVESEGEAAVIDPLRDIDVYLELAKERKATIKYIFETHFHADFVSGHLDLSKATGAPIIYGPGAKTSFPVLVARDSQVFPLGNISFTVLHTPGHTPESACYLLKNSEDKDYCVFTGDTLFAGDVGRPDLAQAATHMTSEELAATLFDSLQRKILPLADDVIVYPGHGAGSACGKHLNRQPFSTIGAEKSTNYALQASTREAFVKAVTEGLDAPPNYFPINAKINKEGYENMEDVLQKGLTPLTVDEVKQQLENDAVLLDTRQPQEFVQGFIPGSISIGLDGRFAEWAGTLLPFDKPLVLVTDEGSEKESIVRLARVGLSNVIGYAAGGYAAWQAAGEPIDLVIEVEADELAMDIPFDDNLVVLDVRKPAEFTEGHVKDAQNIPLAELKDPLNMATLEEEQNVYIHCGSGYRSVVAASLLKRQGIHNIRNVVGGWKAIQQEKRIPTEKEDPNAKPAPPESDHLLN
ncbi:rhodanese-like domain-containing protein [Paraflavisolibacter sp. H34]|uniref:MBL fold metallo-hydrolase n=1 Tax=Huijunlia imazamoxiresistens TaxID=3127457 RepID=UPI00301A7C49